MQERHNQKWVIYGAISIAALLLARHLLPIFFPFLLGIGLALGAEPAAKWLSLKLHFPRWAAAGIGVSGFFIFVVSLLFLLVSVLVRQLGRLSAFLPQLAKAVLSGLEALENWLLGLTLRLPQSMAQVAGSYVRELFSDSSSMLEQAATRVPQLATGIVSKLGQWGLVLFTAVLSGYMISARLPQLKKWCKEKLPRVWQTKYLPAMHGLRRAVGGWLTAQGKLMGLTFALLTVGFFLLGIKNLLPVAALVTLVDAIPVLGTGTVLIPWSIVCLLQADRARGIGLLAIYGVVWLIRSVLEPKVLGKELGLDPLTTLFSVYAGFRLMGFVGMLIAPFAAMVVTQVIKQGK